MTDLARLMQNNFLVIGRAGMDLYPDPPGTKTEEAGNFRVALGGSSANIAAGIVKLGGQAALVTSVSDGAVGRFCLNQLRHYRVDSTHVKSVGGEARNLLALYETHVEDHQSVIYRNGAADFAMTGADVEAIDFSRYGAMITAGTVFAAEPSRSAAFHAFSLARTAGLPVIFDVDYRPYSWPSPAVAEEVLSRASATADVIVGNDEEFGFMAGGLDRWLDMARRLARSTATIVVYKMGAAGAITLTPDAELRTGIYPVKALKPTGAGDSFMAGFVTSLAQDRPLPETVLRGSACAAYVVARPGHANHRSAGGVLSQTPRLHRTLKGSPRAYHPFDNRNQPIVHSGNSCVPLNYFNIVKLSRGQAFEYQVPGYETCIVPATGTVDVDVDVDVDVEGAAFGVLGNRDVDVWDGEPEGVYVPSGARATMACASGSTEVFVAGAKYEKVLDPFDVRAGGLDLVQYGSDDTKTHRKITHILGQKHHDKVGRLLVSELFTVGQGGWSGFPSHKHDTDRLPDETYNFRFRPNHGSGVQMLQRVDKEPGDAFHIVDGSTICLDKGYHPCAVLPGYEMYYFTILGGLSQRTLIQYFQPTHAYQIETIPGVKDMIAKFK